MIKTTKSRDIKRYFSLILIILSFLFCNCTTIAVRSNSLDRAINDAGEIIISRLKDGSRIAVILFYSPSEKLSEYAIDELSAHLVNSYRFDVVERKYLDMVRRELNFQLSGEVSDESALSIGKMLGAQYITLGEIAQVGSKWKLRTFTIHVETAKREVITTADINMNDKDILYLIKNSSPKQGAEKTVSPFDGTWKAGDTLWTFDNNNFMLETPKFIVAGTFLYNNTDFTVTILQYKERAADLRWLPFEQTAYGSFKYVITGNTMFIDGSLENNQMTAILERR
jgi:hypothetical protein